MTCVLFAWAVICATYLRFRLAVNVNRLRGAIPPKALSPLQPYLAIYGLSMSILLSTLPSGLGETDDSYVPGLPSVHTRQSIVVRWKRQVGFDVGCMGDDRSSLPSVPWVACSWVYKATRVELAHSIAATSRCQKWDCLQCGI